MKNIGIVKNFNLYSIKSNEIVDLNCGVVNDEIFIHGYGSNNGKSVSSMSNVNVYMDINGNIYDIKNMISSNHTNRVLVTQYTTLKPSFVKITIVTTNLTNDNSDSIIFGLK